jgi:hypothetical protein
LWYTSVIPATAGSINKWIKVQASLDKRQNYLQNNQSSQELVAHFCNPSYSGGSDQEDCGLKPAWANSSTRSYLEKKPSKKGPVEGLKVQALSATPIQQSVSQSINQSINNKSMKDWRLISSNRVPA